MKRDWRGLVWPIYLYGVRPLLAALHLTRRPQPADSRYREPEIVG